MGRENSSTKMGKLHMVCEQNTQVMGFQSRVLQVQFVHFWKKLLRVRDLDMDGSFGQAMVGNMT